MDTCEVTACTQKVSKTGYTLCLDHWKAQRAGNLSQCPACDRFHDGPSCPACNDAPPDMLSSTRIGKHFNLSNIKINLILAELGWIERYVKGWVPTDRGNALGANVREMRNGVSHASRVRRTPICQPGVSSQAAPSCAANAAPGKPVNLPRHSEGVPSNAPSPRYPPITPQTYDPPLLIEEECPCDFYLPAGKGLVQCHERPRSCTRRRAPTARRRVKTVHLPSRFIANTRIINQLPTIRRRFAIPTIRQSTKRVIYAKHKLRNCGADAPIGIPPPLIELTTPDIERLDDVLPRMLLKFGIESA